MSIVFEAPGWLWLLVPCVPLACFVAVVWPRGAGPVRWISTGARGALLIGLLVAAARPVRLTHDRAVSAVALFDVSTSVSDTDLEREQRLLRALTQVAASPHELRIASFATAPAELALTSGMGTNAKAVGDQAIGRPPAGEGLGTNIGRALGLAAGLGDPTRTRRVLLVSDGRATTGDALAQAAHLAALGIRLDYVVLEGRAPTADVAISGLSAPANIRPHATFPLRVDIATDRPARVRLAVTRNGAALEPRQPPRAMTIPPGTTSVTWDARVDDDTAAAVFAADIQLLDEGDAHPENNRGLLGITPPKPPRALVIAASAADAAPLAAALRAQSIEVQTAPGAATGAFDAALTPATMARVDLIVLCDLPRVALGDGAIAAIGRYVRDGGGLLVTGGPHAFGPGGWSNGHLESLWPVQLDLPQQQDEPSLALALVIDRSGSMSGAKMDLTKQAARGTAEVLPADDQIAVIAFDSQATTIVPLQRAANRLRIATNIGRIQPTGGTNILAGLREAVEQLSTARAKKKHAILLSDGQSSTEGIAELVDAAAGAQITISTIGVGDGVDDALLAMIARQGGGRAYHTRDPSSIPRIFTRETSEVTSSAVVERPTAAHQRQRAGMLGGIAWNESPRLRGYVRTRRRAQADLLLTTDEGDPLLARWSVGLGQVAAWTSDLGALWADDWTRWPPFARFWGQVARGLMRPQTSQEFPAVAAYTDDGAIDVSVEALATDDTFLGGLDGVVEVTDVWSDGTVAGGASRRIPLTESAPGRYEARFAAAAAAAETSGATAGATTTGRAAGALMLRAVLSRAGRPVAQGAGHVSIPLAPELLPASATARTAAISGANLLATVAAITGGGALASPDDLFRGAPSRQRRKPLRSPLLGGLAMLAVADVAFRRLMMAQSARRSR